VFFNSRLRALEYKLRIIRGNGRRERRSVTGYATDEAAGAVKNTPIDEATKECPGTDVQTGTVETVIRMSFSPHPRHSGMRLYFHTLHVDVYTNGIGLYPDPPLKLPYVDENMLTPCPEKRLMSSEMSTARYEKVGRA
jgi:hypothetical protein